MLIPYEMVDPEALQGLIEDFVTRSDTCSSDETPLSNRIERVMTSLQNRSAVIFFDPDEQQPVLVNAQDVPVEMLRDLASISSGDHT